MVKQISFDNYDETTVRKTIGAVQSFGPVGPQEVSVVINSKRFTLLMAPTLDVLIAQLNALQNALNTVK